MREHWQSTFVRGLIRCETLKTILSMAPGYVHQIGARDLNSEWKQRRQQSPYSEWHVRYSVSMHGNLL